MAGNPNVTFTPHPPKNCKFLTAVSSSCYFKGSSLLHDPDPEEEDTRILHTTHQQRPTHQHIISQHSHIRGLDFPFCFCSFFQWLLTRGVKNTVGVVYKNSKVTTFISVQHPKISVSSHHIRTHTKTAVWLQ